MEENLYMADNAAEQAEEILTEIADNGDAAVNTNSDLTDLQENSTSEQETNVQESMPEDDNAQTAAANSGEGDITRTQEFSRRLNAMTAKGIDRFVESMGWVNSYTSEPIKTKAEYERFLEMHEAAKKGENPMAIDRISQLEKRVFDYTVKEQDMNLLNDPDRGEIYKAMRDDVLRVVEHARMRGIPNVDVEAAFTTLLSQNLPAIIAKATAKTQNDTVKKITAVQNAGVGALNSPEQSPKADINNMSDADFETLIERVKKGEKIVL